MKFQASRTTYAFIALAVVILVLVCALVLQRHGNDSPTNDTTSQVSIPPSGIAYPATWKEANTISTTDKQAGVISEATLDNPSVKVIVRKADGELAKDFDIKALPDLVVTSLTHELDGFKLSDKSIVHMSSYDAVKIDYTLSDTDDPTTKHTDTMFIIPTQHSTYYATYSIVGNSLSKLQDEIQTINTSLASYIQKHAS
jgi:hypothetical protein